MQFPLSLSDISLFLAVTSAILLITAEFVSPYNGQINLLVDKGRLRKVALASATAFLFTILIQILAIVVNR